MQWWEATPQPLRYVREPDAITVALKGNNTYQIVYTGNSSSPSLVTSDLGRLRLLDVAMDGAGVRSD